MQGPEPPVGSVARTCDRSWGQLFDGLAMGHLSDNKITGDALMATHGLYRVGEAALPILLHNRRFMDPQARKLIDLIQLDLKSPPRSKQDLYKRSGYSVSAIYHDAAIEYDMRRSPIPQISGR